MSDPSQNCLVIPDVHQNIRWVEAILAKEAAEAGRIVFLGDYFDSKVESAADATETASYFSKLSDRYQAEFTFLVGNHDLPYLYDLQRNRQPNSSDGNPYSNGAYNAYLTPSIGAALAKSFIASLEPFALVEGWLLSHAGVHPDHLQRPDRAGLDTLYRKLKTQVDKLPSDRSAELAAIGTARGGAEPRGGIVWQDWFQEFEDTLEWPQIVGHTLIPEASQKGRSWNLDTRSGSYGIISEGGLTIRTEAKAP